MKHCALKYCALAGLTLAVVFCAALDTTWAKALRRCSHGGYCPAGTCEKFNPARRVQWACNVANCSAANCPR